METDYDVGVFVNCPFDDAYAPLFNAVVFAVYDCGFIARCALETDNSAQVRIDKLFDLIAKCRYGIHDISRTEPDQSTGLPRFNMPLELGLFLGARRYGDHQQQRKSCVILDREPYRYQAFCSDIAGQDIKAHGGKLPKAVRLVRDWLADAPTAHDTRLPSGSRIYTRYKLFIDELPDLCLQVAQEPDELTYSDYTSLVTAWLRNNA